MTLEPNDDKNGERADQVPDDLKKEALRLLIVYAIDPVINKFAPQATDRTRSILRFSVAVVMLAVVGAGGIWGVPYVAATAHSEWLNWTLPRAQGDRIAILVADLSDDSDHRLTDRVENALREELGTNVEILAAGLPVSMGTRGSLDVREQAANEEGQRLLRQSGANVLIWGEAVESNRYADLHFLASDSKSANQSKEHTYSLSQTLHLQADFGSDLGTVIAAVAVATATPANDTSRYVVDTLRPIERRLSALSANKPMHASASTYAKILMAYGWVCFAIGDQTGDQSELLTASASFRKALAQLDATSDSSDWASAQNELGSALVDIGERKGDTTLLEQAVAAFREALLERTEQRVPLDWATTQSNLGVALADLGEREGDTALLEQAVAAYHEALKEFTQQRVPLDWAMTQNNLGNVLCDLGERKGDTALLEQAVAAYREALKEYTQVRVPLDWAMTQNNLGNVLRSLGERKGDTALLERAMDAFREALKERTPERVPYDWEQTTRNLAKAEDSLAALRAKKP